MEIEGATAHTFLCRKGQEMIISNVTVGHGSVSTQGDMHLRQTPGEKFQDHVRRGSFLTTENRLRLKETQ